MIRSLCKYNYSDEDRFLCAKKSGRVGCTGCMDYDDGENKKENNIEGNTNQGEATREI